MQRGAQFMADIGDEIGFDLNGKIGVDARGALGYLRAVTQDCVAKMQ